MRGDDKAAELASAIIDFRRVRLEVLPREFFGEPAWEMLLELFLADAKGLRLTGRQVSERWGITEGVMSRWLMHLGQAGFIVGDGTGNLADELTLSGDGMARMERVMAHAAEFKRLVDDPS